VSAGRRAVADAVTQLVVRAREEDADVQVTIKAAPNFANMTVLVEAGGVESIQPFSPLYTPEVGHRAWLRGPVGARIITDRVGAQQAGMRLPATLVDARGSIIARGEVRAEGNSVSELDTVAERDVRSFRDLISGRHISAPFGNTYARDGVFSDGTISTSKGFNCDLGARVGGNAQIDGTLHADGQLQANGIIHSDSQVQGASGSFGGEVGAGSFSSNNYYGGTFHGTLNGNWLQYPGPSERELKYEESVIDGAEAVEVIDRLVAARFRWKTPDSVVPWWDAEVHAGVYVNELAAAAPETVRTRDDGVRSYEDRGLMAYLVAALAHRGREVDMLRSQLADLSARLDAIGA